MVGWALEINYLPTYLPTYLPYTQPYWALHPISCRGRHSDQCQRKLRHIKGVWLYCSWSFLPLPYYSSHNQCVDYSATLVGSAGGREKKSSTVVFYWERETLATKVSRVKNWPLLFPCGGHSSLWWFGGGMLVINLPNVRVQTEATVNTAKWSCWRKETRGSIHHGSPSRTMKTSVTP